MELISESSLNLVFVDPSISNYDEIATSSIRSGFETFVLDSSQDGLEQVTQILTQKDNVDSIHIISHGSLGSIELGDRSINSDNLDEYQDILTSWSNHLSEDADILLYGCDVGQDGSFVDQLSDFTGADIAASDDLTGNSALGGDWDLEVQTGEIEASLALDAETQLSFEGILANDWVVETDPNFSNELLITGLNQPIDLAQLPSGELLILQKDGEILITDPDASNPTTSPYLTITDINTGGERGLISITLDPDFELNNHFYLYYSKESTRTFQISRFTHNGDSADLSSESVIWQDNEPYQSNAHYGGGLDFGPDGKLYLTTAEEFDRDQATDLTRAGGKIIRINKDGTIPEDNPFIDGPGGNLDEIWAYGLRNPWRASWDLETERFFINEVGGNDPETAREDVHIGEAGANYGWPLYEGISNDPDISDPIFTYDHSEDAKGAAAISSGIVYRGNNFPSQYDGVYFFGDYAQEWIRYLAFDANGDVIDADPSTDVVEAFNFNQNAGRVVSFEEGQDGALYYLDIYVSPNILGQLRKISYNGTSNQTPVIDQATADQTSGAGPLTVNFSSSATDAENDPLTYTWDFGDGNQATGADVTHTFDTNGLYDVSLTVSDGTNNVNLEPAIEIAVGAAPEASIDGPINGNFFRAGDTINLVGSATDADGVLGEQNYQWTFNLLHRGAEHPRFEPITGTTGSIVVPTNDSLDFSGDTGYEIILQVEDSDGLTDTEQIVIYPEKSDLTFDSNVPGDVTFTIDDVPKSGSFVYDSAINWEHVVSVPETVISGGLIYSFDSWSDGIETATRSLVVPENDQSYTASYIVTGESSDVPITDGLVLQLDANSGVSSDENGVVSAWEDQSGSGNDLSSIGNPTIVTNELNGNSVISLDGDEDRLERRTNLNDLPAGNSDRTVFMVAKYDSVGNGGFTYGKKFTNEAFGLQVKNDGDLMVQAWGSKNDADSNVDGTAQGWLSQSAVLNSGNLTHYKDGTVIDSRTRTYNTLLDRIVVGAEIDGTPSVDMDVAEILVFDRALSETERQQVENYLQLKYFNQSSGDNNQQPNAVEDQFEVAAESSNNIFDVLANDSDPDGDALMLMSVDTPSNGTIEINTTDNILRYTPDSGFIGTETFNYQISDGNGGTSEATMTVNVIDLGAFPDAVDDSFSVTEDSQDNSLDVLLNDSHPDNDTFSILSVGQSDNGGTVTINNSNDGLVYTPLANFEGTETFSYTVSDSNGKVDTATVTLTVNNLNDTPDAVNDNFNITVDSSNNSLNVLANDTDPDSGDTLTITEVSATSNGGNVTINSNPDGLIYTPASGFIGTETFTYTLSDSEGSTSTAEVSINVAQQLAPPITDGLVLQLEANSGVTSDENGVVSAWEDQSGSGNDLNGFGDPTIVTNELNGNSIISLDGDEDRLERRTNLNDLPAGNSDRTVFMVAKYDSVGNGGFTYGKKFTNEAFGLQVKNDGDLMVQAWGRKNDADSNVDGTAQGWLSQSAVLNSGNLTHYKDGTVIDNRTRTYNTFLDRIVIGAEIDGTPSVDMDVAEILVFDRALSETERQQVEDYLQLKYFGV